VPIAKSSKTLTGKGFEDLNITIGKHLTTTGNNSFSTQMGGIDFNAGVMLF
jgi:hypothetical protein